MEKREWTDYDIFLVREFCAGELRKYLRPMRDFWKHAASYAERGPGEHPLLDSVFAGDVGYRVERRNIRHGNVRGLMAYPFVRTMALKVVPSGGDSKLVLRRALDDPLRVEEFYCVLDGDRRIAFLDAASYAVVCSGSRMEACIPLGREEAYAILSDKPLAKTKSKLARAFDMEEGEWLEHGDF